MSSIALLSGGFLIDFGQGEAFAEEFADCSFSLRSTFIQACIKKKVFAFPGLIELCLL